jgi:hypothetical protein
MLFCVLYHGIVRTCINQAHSKFLELSVMNEEYRASIENKFIMIIEFIRNNHNSLIMKYITCRSTLTELYSIL